MLIAYRRWSLLALPEKNMSTTSLIQSWRRLIFFERDVVKDPTNEAEPYSDLKDLNIACCSAGEDVVCIGDRDGGIHLLNRQWNDTYFRAYKVALCLLLCPQADSSVLLSIGDDEDGINPYLKVWQLDRLDKQGVPFVVRCSKTSPSNRPVKTTSLAVDSTLSLMAVGFEDSSLMLYRGDVRKERQGKGQLLRDGLICEQEGAVVGLAFHNMSPDTTILYVVTTQLTMSFVLGLKEKETKKTVLERHGSSPDCWALADQELQWQFVVGRSEGIYFYQPEEKGGCKIFHGDKVMVRTFGPYLIVVSKEGSPKKLAVAEKMQLITVYEVVNSFIAYFSPIPEVQDIFVAWESVYILTAGGRLYCLKEMDLKSKLELLFRKKLFDLAINVAEKHNMDRKEVTNIYRLYGDYFFQKGDYSNAFKQYSRTIGSLETSYVVRKFLEVRRVDNLAEYLEAVFQAGLGNSEHANLLLSCYSKQGRKDKIDQLLRERQLPFDVDDAVWTLRSSGFYEQAAELTKRCGYPERCLAVLMSDIKDFKQAIQYIGSLTPEVNAKFFIQYSKELMENVPDETMGLLKKFCAEPNSPDKPCSVIELIPYLVAFPELMEELLEYVIMEWKSNLDPRIYNSLISLYLNKYELLPESEEKREQSAKIMAFLSSHETHYEHLEALRLMFEKRFHAGILFLLERKKMYSHLVRHLISLGDCRSAIDVLVKHGSAMESKYLWGYLLKWFASDPNVPERYVAEALRHIECAQAMEPMMVVQILGTSRHLTFSCIRDYLLGWLRQGHDAVRKNKEVTKGLQAEIRRAEAVVEDLKTNPQTFQLSRCSVCDIMLEVPTVHFLCKHSFHQHCFENYSENETACPVCLPERLRLKAAFKTEPLSSNELAQRFADDLTKSGDVAGTLVNYFAKGIFLEESMTVDTQHSSKTVNGTAFLQRESPASVSIDPSLNPFDDDDSND
uniref:Vacuolar protein sorting-associated protein 11 homolog n=1 Tax=Trichuris muris TaxID=70415 RepID=A0A5S6R317_TRIMR